VVLVFSSSYSARNGIRISRFSPSSACTNVHLVRSLPTECCSGRAGTADPY
jgi:hypothetical protein